jgi:hypothetical protein
LRSLLTVTGRGTTRAVKSLLVLAILLALVACGDEGNQAADDARQTGEADVTTELFDGVVETDYGQFDLCWSPDYLGYDGSDDRYFAGQVNGLVGSGDPGGVYLTLARRSGGSSVRIVLHDTEPQLDQDWEDVVEVSTTVPEDAQPGWGSWAGETGGRLAIPPATYRLRVSARGRDAGRGDGELAEGVVDFYLLDMWPAPVADDEIIRTGSDDARYWHRSRGSRRG